MLQPDLPVTEELFKQAEIFVGEIKMYLERK